MEGRLLIKEGRREPTPAEVEVSGGQKRKGFRDGGLFVSVRGGNRGVNKDLYVHRDESDREREKEGMMEAEWEESREKKNRKTSWAVCLSQQQYQKLNREKKVWVGKHSREREKRERDRCGRVTAP